MRLGQLARKLGLSPNAIAEHLTASGLQVESDPNRRLEDDRIRIVVSHFAPARIEEFIKPAEQPAQEPAPVDELTSTHEVMAEMPEVTETVQADVPPDPAEVIRAAKVELQGLKVIGKIELPQAKKKADDEQPATEGTIHADDSRPPRRGPLQDRKEQRQWKNPMELKRQREEAEAKRKREEQAEEAKAKRTQNYLKRVKSVPTKAVRRVEEEVVVEADVDAAPRPKTAWGKFVKWLTT
jgi:hypothetical protein